MSTDHRREEIVEVLSSALLSIYLIKPELPQSGLRST